MNKSFKFEILKKTEVKFTKHKISHFKTRNSGAFSTFTMLCNKFHFYQGPRYCHHPKGNRCLLSRYIYTHTHMCIYHFLPLVPGNHQSVFSVYGFTYSAYFIWMESWWLVLMCFTSFTERDTFENHSHCSMNQDFFAFYDWIIFYCLHISQFICSSTDVHLGCFLFIFWLLWVWVSLL